MATGTRGDGILRSPPGAPGFARDAGASRVIGGRPRRPAGRGGDDGSGSRADSVTVLARGRPLDSVSGKRADHRLRSLPFDYRRLEPAISEGVVHWHHDVHQRGYVDKRNEIEDRLAAVDPARAHANYSEWGELKRKESFNASGMILHDLYWECLGGAGGGPPAGAVRDAIERDFGSVDKWRADFVATAKCAFGWAVLAWDPSDDRVHDYLVDFHHHGAVWGCVPLLAIDVWEHAYYKDRGPDRAAYIEGFLSMLEWPHVEDRWRTFVAPVREAMARRGPLSSGRGDGRA